MKYVKFTYKVSIDVQNSFKYKKCVYCVQDLYSGNIKIGTTTEIAARFNGLINSSSSGGNLNIIYLFDFGNLNYYRDCEGYLHEHFIEHRLNGEWFSSDILSSIIYKVKDYCKEKNLEFKNSGNIEVMGIDRTSKDLRGRNYSYQNKHKVVDHVFEHYICKLK